jgi:hypothetical protein
VGYQVELRWKALSLRLAGFTFAPGNVPPSSRLTLRGAEEPRLDEQSLAWTVPGLQLEGHWDALAPPLDATLLDGPEGVVEWRCLQPASRVRLSAGNETLEGFGYAERLVLTLPPWQLPITGLRWGRFVGEGQALVWIDWEGPHHRRLLAHNGLRVEPGEVGEERVVSADGRIRLDLRRHSVLREAPLGQTLGKLITKLPALPRKLLGLEEQKWVARGELRVPGQPPVTGWVIHERVTWPADAA